MKRRLVGVVTLALVVATILVNRLMVPPRAARRRE